MQKYSVLIFSSLFLFLWKCKNGSEAEQSVIKKIDTNSSNGVIINEATVNYSKNDFEIFWAGFRAHVLDKQYDSLIEDSSFPLIVRGSLDIYPELKIDTNEFIKMFEKLLNEEVINRQGMITNKFKIIEDMESPHYLTKSDTFIQIDSYLFLKKKDHWKLAFVYTDVLYSKEKLVK